MLIRGGHLVMAAAMFLWLTCWIDGERIAAIRQNLGVDTGAESGYDSIIITSSVHHTNVVRDDVYPYSRQQSL